MSIQILSDLHLEAPKTYIFEVVPRAPYLALLGDIGNTALHRDDYLAFLTRQLKQFRAVLLVPGNHEPYQSDWAKTLVILRAYEESVRKDSSLGEFVLLDRVAFRLPDINVTILGCSLFSSVPPESEMAVSVGLNDFFQILDWDVDAHNKMHKRDLAWLNAQVTDLEDSGRQNNGISAKTYQQLTGFAAVHIRTMTIKLGLQRMHDLYGKSPQLWKAIHVAGTNGKGSVCSYVSSLLARSNISHGRFTSPFIRRPEDSILINNTPIPTDLFRSFYYAADKAPAADKPTHFERMTYAAFAAFDHFDVKYGVVETGLGGRLDSTNILRNKAVTVITKIGIDHQEYLGDTMELIAAEKAGIMNGAPCVINGRNAPEALGVLLDTARRVGSKAILTTDDARLTEESNALTSSSSGRGWPQHVLDNATCAIKACEQLEEFRDSPLHIADLLSLPGAQMEGRLQEVDISSTHVGRGADRRTPIILDGAHNLDAVAALAEHVDRNVRAARDGSSGPVTWVIGMSNPRESTASEILGSLIRPGDGVVFTEYERPAGGQTSTSQEDYFLSFRPEPLRGAKLEDAIRSMGEANNPVASCATVDEALRAACQMAKMPKNGGETPIVVTGSLYLIADVLKWADGSKLR
ncbi:uncharacterized protein DNG_01025 [Cephalotrichum gorgonifer]|uniref:Mur ligase central domain-containing protein n=1 Tax=Cephalotrichum gorgonifer TaxID=2041049 RepID=A0AAE8SR99_9PEZI|nr:uncharacterized protein DNG_01025 [Cephalotrichum gorgonifer]